MDDQHDAIDRLYQADLAAFIAERNALAKSAKRPDLKALEKPSLPAWLVNQLYWRRRPLFDQVVHAAERLRDQHRLVLSGQPAEVRSAETAHRAAVVDAVAATRDLAAAAGHPMTAATVEAVTRTLEALPAPEAHGRLVRALSPAGLEALAGLSLSPVEPAPLRLVESPPTPAAVSTASPPTTAVTAAAERERFRAAREAREREALEARQREAREREARRHEAEAAVDAAAQAYLAAQDAVAEAEDALTARRAERDTAAAAYDRAKRAARELV